MLNLPPWVRVGVRCLLSKYSSTPPTLPWESSFRSPRAESCNSPPHSARNKAGVGHGESQAGPGLANPLLSGGHRHTQPPSAPAEVEREGNFPRGSLRAPSTAGSLSLPPEASAACPASQLALLPNESPASQCLPLPNLSVLVWGFLCVLPRALFHCPPPHGCGLGSPSRLGCTISGKS